MMGAAGGKPIPDDDQQAQEHAERGAADALEALLGDADRSQHQRERWGSAILCDLRFDEEALGTLALRYLIPSCQPVVGPKNGLK
jgi:hypothetical protein